MRMTTTQHTANRSGNSHYRDEVGGRLQVAEDAAGEPVKQDL